MGTRIGRSMRTLGGRIAQRPGVGIARIDGFRRWPRRHGVSVQEVEMLNREAEVNRAMRGPIEWPES